ncbi:hypothetical protein NQ315_009965 [Exocentrus adspersus]|uniref:CHK kinase-like domain-containing protein n=1 Tax=Exocentrus adspersus TaxID=1586481 RepID=A0AAV8WHU9_9CUCU|nr:hypothetical protein NQ315_009965 [Exocentrus adspersus]
MDASPEKTVPRKIHEVLRVLVHDLENYRIAVQDANKKGDRYLGEVFFITMEQESAEPAKNVVLKLAFYDASTRNARPIRATFLNEVYFYTKLWPKLVEFQQAIPPGIGFFHVAKCLETSVEAEAEWLVLENLKHEGFAMHDKKKPLSRNQLEMIFELYGRFHAISLAYKALKPREFQELTKEAKEHLKRYFEPMDFKKAISKWQKRCLRSLVPGVDDAVIEKYEGYVAKGMEVFSQSQVVGKYTAIIHGDCWSNNMMFKYDNSGNVLDVRFLDFQQSRLASPACDLSYCLYSGGTKADFDELTHLLQVYHDSLKRNLAAYGCDPVEVYPFQALEEDWARYCHFGVSMGLLLWRVKLAGADGSSVDEEEYRRRTRDIILHLYENNYM